MRTRCFIVTGLSGAGKSTVLKILEDLGVFCVDNLPLPLLSQLLQIYRKRGRKLGQIAVGLDIRTRILLKDLEENVLSLSQRGIETRILYLDSDTRTLVRRFSETRYRHPLGPSLYASIRKERKILQDLKSHADKVVDTSGLTHAELKEVIHLALDFNHRRKLTIAVVSFGYKYGLPIDADMVLDVRFLPNPNYRSDMKFKTGEDPKVSRYVLSQKAAKGYLTRVKALLNFLVPQWKQEGKSYFSLAVGCTGGRHRSVVLARTFAKFLRDLGLEVRIHHRDVEK